MTSPDRYDGKPLLRLIEGYALAVIGELPAEAEETVRLVVQRVFESDGTDWMSTLRGELGWSPAIDDTIRENWLRYREAARDAKVENDAIEFSVLFADAVTKAEAESDD
jgi:hypothetical protein